MNRAERRVHLREQRLIALRKTANADITQLLDRAASCRQEADKLEERAFQLQTKLAIAQQEVHHATR